MDNWLAKQLESRLVREIPTEISGLMESLQGLGVEFQLQRPPFPDDEAGKYTKVVLSLDGLARLINGIREASKTEFEGGPVREMDVGMSGFGGGLALSHNRTSDLSRVRHRHVRRDADGKPTADETDAARKERMEVFEPSPARSAVVRQ